MARSYMCITESQPHKIFILSDWETGKNNLFIILILEEGINFPFFQ